MQSGFYGTKNRFKNLVHYNCNSDHRLSNEDEQLLNTKRIFEIILTGYNKSLSLAYIHEYDFYKVCLDKLHQKCKEEKITLIVVEILPKTNNLTLIRNIVRSILEAKVIDVELIRFTDAVRTRMKSDTFNHKLFKNRCNFHATQGHIA